MAEVVADVAGLAKPANAMASKAIVPQGLVSSTLTPCTSEETQNPAGFTSTCGTVAEGTDVTAFCSGSFFLSSAIRKRIVFSMWQTFVAAVVCQKHNAPCFVAR